VLKGFGRNQLGFALGPVLHAHRRPLESLCSAYLLQSLFNLVHQRLRTLAAAA
jgi:hypothetical protein